MAAGYDVQYSTVQVTQGETEGLQTDMDLTIEKRRFGTFGGDPSR